MKKASNLLLALGLVLTVVTGVSVFMFLQSAQAEKAVPPPMVNIVVAAQEIQSYRPITAEMLELKAVPASSVRPEHVRDVASVVGKAVSARTVKGQEIISSMLSEQGFSYAVPKGKRAMALSVDGLSVLNGLLREGDRVDIIFTGNFPQVNVSEGNDGKHAAPKAESPTGKTILQNIEVLKVQSPTETAAAAQGAQLPEGQQEQAAASGGWTVLLAVTDQEAEILTFGRQNGSLSLVMRANGDTAVEGTTGVSESILTEKGVPLPVQPRE